MEPHTSQLIKIFTGNRTLLILLICIIVLSIYQFKYQYNIDTDEIVYQNVLVQRPCCEDSYKDHQQIIEKFYEKRKNWKTSNLGSILFKNIAPEVFRHRFREKQTYVVLIWKHYDWLKKRHIQGFNRTANNFNEDPLTECRVTNCIFSGDENKLNSADAVVVHIQKGIFPNVTKRNPNQRWIFLSDESPRNTFSLAGRKKVTLKSIENVFNWSMTYRSDSDVPVPYGRTLPLPEPITPIDLEYPDHTISKLIPYWNIKETGSIAVLISNCAVKTRMAFLKELQQYINVDVHGGCATNPNFKMSCPGHFRAKCGVLSTYLFYLVLENSKCRQYLTEKIFDHAYAKGAIPVIMGPPLEDCEKLLPPNSFIHVDSFKSVSELAKYIQTISNSYEDLLSYHKWRNNFEVVSEHGYFGMKSMHYCRVCEALNYNDGEISIYDEDGLNLFLDQNLVCT